MHNTGCDGLGTCAVCEISFGWQFVGLYPPNRTHLIYVAIDLYSGFIVSCHKRMFKTLHKVFIPRAHS